MGNRCRFVAFNTVLISAALAASSLAAEAQSHALNKECELGEHDPVGAAAEKPVNAVLSLSVVGTKNV